MLPCSAPQGTPYRMMCWDRYGRQQPTVSDFTQGKKRARTEHSHHLQSIPSSAGCKYGTAMSMQSKADDT